MREEDPSAELARLAEGASSAYEQNTALRAAVVAIPSVGSSLDFVLASEAQRRLRERIFKLIHAMQEHMETIEDNAIDKEYLRSEEFFDLLLKAFESATKTRDDRKLRMYAQILTESTVHSKREGYSPEEYLDVIADLTPRELLVARALYRDLPGEGYENRETNEIQEAWRAWQDRVRTEVGIDGADLQLILGRLHSLDLITEDAGLWPISVGPIETPPQYWVSPAFKKLMRFLEEGDDYRANLQGA